MTKDKSLQTKTFIEALCQFNGECMIELKPCPFCGRTDSIRYRSGEDGSGIVYCDHHGVCGPSPQIVHNKRNDVRRCCSISSMSDNPAREHWNERPIEDALKKRIAELEMINAASSFLEDAWIGRIEAGDKRIAELEANEKTFTEMCSAYTTYIAELEAENAALRKNATVWHVFDIDNPNTYPQTANMYLALSMPDRDEYREPDTNSTYDVLWWELYSEEYWLKHGITHWAELPAPPEEKP